MFTFSNAVSFISVEFPKFFKVTQEKQCIDIDKSAVIKFNSCFNDIDSKNQMTVVTTLETPYIRAGIINLPFWKDQK